MDFLNGFEKTAHRWDKTRVYADYARHAQHMGKIKKEKMIAGGAAAGLAAGGALALHRRTKTADAPGSPMIDPAKAAAIQKGALSGGPTFSQSWANLKAGLGIGRAANVGTNQ